MNNRVGQKSITGILIASILVAGISCVLAWRRFARAKTQNQIAALRQSAQIAYLRPPLNAVAHVCVPEDAGFVQAWRNKGLQIQEWQSHERYRLIEQHFPLSVKMLQKYPIYDMNRLMQLHRAAIILICGGWMAGGHPPSDIENKNLLPKPNIENYDQPCRFPDEAPALFIRGSPDVWYAPAGHSWPKSMMSACLGNKLDITEHVGAATLFLENGKMRARVAEGNTYHSV